MSKNKELIYYQNVSCKTCIQFTNDSNKFRIEIKDPYIEYDKCYGEKQYIRHFIERLKTTIIKKLPNLNEVKISIGIFDKNNVWHSIIIQTVQMLSNILNLNIKKNIYHTIFVVILYNNRVVFHGGLEFND